MERLEGEFIIILRTEIIWRLNDMCKDNTTPGLLLPFSRYKRALSDLLTIDGNSFCFFFFDHIWQIFFF